PPSLPPPIFSTTFHKPQAPRYFSSTSAYKAFALLCRRAAFLQSISSLPCSPASTFFLLVSPAQDGNRPRVPSRAQERRRHGRSGVRGRGGGEPAVAAVAEAAAGDELLRAMPGARRRAQERVQHVLPRLRQRRALLALPRPPPRPPRHPGQSVDHSPMPASSCILFLPCSIDSCWS
uniref:Uncharacterized protein n=1 Tax=Triticum urartu TaxID=4572 RepID=A0A8R7UYU1_TRIUA